MSVVDRSAEPPYPVRVWWWDRRLDVEVPPTYGICWVELVEGREARFGQVAVSRRTAEPADADDPVVAAELHYQMQRRLGTMIRVDHASRHLAALGVDRRLAVRGCPTATVSMGGVDPDVLGGLTVRLPPGGGHPGRLLLVLRNDLGPGVLIACCCGPRQILIPLVFPDRCKQLHPRLRPGPFQ
jgi:hypothetical protein